MRKQVHFSRGACRWHVQAARNFPAWIPALTFAQYLNSIGTAYRPFPTQATRSGGKRLISHATCRFQWSKSTRNLKEEIKRYSPLIEPPSFQWKVKLTINVAYSVSPFYSRPTINAEISERSMFNFVPGINCPWERTLSLFKNRHCFWRTHNLTSNCKRMSLLRQ